MNVVQPLALHATRWVELPGCLNFRDLGGYPVARGGVTAWQRVFRSDNLSHLTHEGRSRLTQLGIRTVVDLRDRAEVEHAPNPLTDDGEISYLHNAVRLPDGVQVGAGSRPQSLDMPLLYRSMIDGSQSTFLALFRLLARASAHPVVIHCNGGRDRTGVACALILGAAGVPREHVVEDYLLSANVLEAQVDRMAAVLREAGVPASEVLETFRLRKANLAAALDVVDGQFGGVDSYLSAIGVSAEELESFRRWFVTPGQGD